MGDTGRERPGVRQRTSDAPLDAECDCETCTTFSRAYLRPLFVVGDMWGCGWFVHTRAVS